MKIKPFWIAFFSAFMISTSSQPIYAQSTSVEQLNAILEQAEVRKKIAEARQAEAEARRAELDAALPFKGTATQTPVSNEIKINEPGGTTPQGYYPIENQILAHQSLQKVVQGISKQLLDSKIKVSTIVIHDSESFNDLKLYESYESISGLLTIGYNSVLRSASTESVVDIVEIPTAIFRSAADFAALFRSEVKIDQLALKEDKDAVIAQLASEIRSSSNVSVVYPEVYALDQGLSSKSILISIQDLSKLRREAEKKLAAIQELAKSEKTLPKDSQKAKETLEYLNQKYDETFKNLFTLNQTATATFQSLARGKQISTHLKKPNSYVLYITVQASGSNQRKRSIFSSRLRHSGGVLVNYLLFSPTGEIKLSDSLYSHSGFTRMDGLLTNVKEK